MPEIEEALIQAARGARRAAYAPYSGYKVGAAILDSSGRVWTGANVENVSSGATLCAERVALGKMVSAGARSVEMVAVATADGGTPCGICRQSLLEFASDPSEVQVLLADESRQIGSFSLAELIPYGFSPATLRRTES
jgi:cytidine deaminase